MTVIYTHTAGMPFGFGGIDEINLSEGRPDLLVEMRSDRAAALPGDAIVYQVRYGNPSKILAWKATLTELLPPGLVFQSSLPPPDALLPYPVWDVGTLAAYGNLRTLTITATVATTATLGVNLANTLQIASASPELELDNNLAEALVYIGQRHLLPLVAR